MCSALAVALALAIVVLDIFGIGARGSEMALRVTARWSFLFFWLAYVGPPFESLFGALFHGLARRRRELGLAFASSMAIHLALVLWLLHISTAPGGTMALFWGGILFTYALALLSLPKIRRPFPPLVLTVLFTVGTEFIAFVFAADFILLPFDGGTVFKQPAYLPFALMLVSGAIMRILVFIPKLVTLLTKGDLARRKA